VVQSLYSVCLPAIWYDGTGGESLQSSYAVACIYC
jgi:hypothetical protein